MKSQTKTSENCPLCGGNHNDPLSAQGPNRGMAALKTFNCIRRKWDEDKAAGLQVVNPPEIRAVKLPNGITTYVEVENPSTENQVS